MGESQEQHHPDTRSQGDGQKQSPRPEKPLDGNLRAVDERGLLPFDLVDLQIEDGEFFSLLGPAGVVKRPACA